MLSLEQKACNFETSKHIARVRELLNKIIVELLARGENHDKSKLESPEVEIFTELTPKLANLTFGSEEYKESLKELGPALEHHYANNRHHPEFHKRGIEDMNLIDIIEMLADWKASSELQNNGNLRKSLDINGKRYGLSDQLMSIMENTIDLLD